MGDKENHEVVMLTCHSLVQVPGVMQVVGVVDVGVIVVIAGLSAVLGRGVMAKCLSLVQVRGGYARSWGS